MPKVFKIKVCGMKNRLNIHELQQLPIQYMGLIFYAASKRFVDKTYTELGLQHTPKHIKLTGVFVNENIANIQDKLAAYHLSAVQLHGDESPDFCLELRKKTPNIQIFKAFGVDECFNFQDIQAYEKWVDYFLFDTKTIFHGGSGMKFDWQFLSNYNLNLPFFLSGGISVDDIDEIHNFEHPKLEGLDLNSKFEITPGLKNIALVKQFLNALKKD